jgi:DNA-binding IclR family transcriptional regulator
MSLSGPAERILTNRREIAAALIAACREISRRMGFRERSVANV